MTQQSFGANRSPSFGHLKRPSVTSGVRARISFLGLALGCLLVSASAAQAQEVGAPAPGETAPVPPHVEETPVASAGTNYCFEGPHPTDPAASGGVTWEATTGRHLHPYPPLDLRLFALRDGCYYFIGDPADFGYRGQTYSYYGAHPVAANHGGGWCFMIGGHAHLWGPWSHHFVTAGPWFYWHGPYDPFFWSYWPYYAVYYRHHYPRYYGGGRFGRDVWHTNGHRGGRRGYAVAPAIGPVPAPARATPTGAFHGNQGAFGRDGNAGPGNAGWRRDPSVHGSAWGAPTRGAPTPAFTGVGRSPSPGTTDGWVGGNRGWTATPSGRGDGGWRSAPRATPASPVLRSNSGSFFRSTPASPSFRSGGGGGGQFAPRSGGWRTR